MDKNKKRWLIVLGIVLLIGLIIIALVLGWFSKRGKAFDSRPLVLIHEPIYDGQFRVGDGVIIHATATEEYGLARIELWVNDVLIDAQDAEEPEMKDLALLSTWVPTYEGEQQIIVRAISSDDVSGQSSIRINVVAGEESTTFYIVEEGETLESIAEEFGTSPEEIEDLNPGLGEDGPAPGDGLILPGDEPAPERSSTAPESDSEPPVFGGAPALMESTFSFSDVIPSREMPMLLRLEVPRLETEVSYEGLHCYLGLADHLPQWYPDRDHNQTTNEWFEALGDGIWNTEDILVGNAVPLIIWPHDQSLPATINCVGITGGGSDSVELGQLDIQIPPFWWTGIRRTFELEGAGGRLEVDIRVSKYNGGSRLTPKTPDPDMEIPSNLRLDEETRTFSWDYSEESESIIFGFEIFLNGNLLWTEEPSRRESRMPDEWFRPPCGSTYIFGVRAYRYDSEDDIFYESPMEHIDLYQPETDCVRQLQITFLTIETFDLGGDGDYEDRIGDVGPAYGTFFANRGRFSFGEGNDVLGLEHHTLYGLGALADHSDWHPRGTNTVYTDLPEGRTLRVGYTIMDRDGNRDDVICRGVHLPLFDEIVDFDEVITSTIISDNRQCEVRFEIRPGPDSPIGLAGEEEPLPWLDWIMHSVVEGDSRGEIRLRIGNTGTAGWSEQDLVIGLFTREGEFIKEVTIPDFDLPAGEAVFVAHDDLRLPEPHDFCLHLDLYDAVLELHERRGALTHTVECPELPDLEVHDAYYQDHSTNRIRVEVQNVGDIDWVDRSLTVEVRRLDDNSRLFDPVNFHSLTFRRGETRVLTIPVEDASVRLGMADGYVVILNPDTRVVESSYVNNDYTVGEATRLSAYLSSIHVPIAAADIVEIHIDGYIRTGRVSEIQVLDLNVSGEDIDWSCDEALNSCVEVFWDYQYFQDWFEIYGDEDLRIVINFDHRGTRGGGGSLMKDFTTEYTFEPPGWGSGEIDSTEGRCYFRGTRVIGNHNFSVYDGSYEWGVVFDFCRENYGE